MDNNIKEILSSIDSITTLDSGEDLTHLQELVDLYFNHPEAGNYLDVWFRFYERFPDENGESICWGILHGIENYHPTSDRFAVESVLRKPSEFPLMMVNRLINGRIERVGDVELLKLLQHISINEDYSPMIREKAQDYLNYQKEKSVA